jgi:hypothetical protein
MNLTDWLTLETEEGDIEFKVLVDTEDPNDWEILEVRRNGEPYEQNESEFSMMLDMADEWAKEAEQDYFDDMREMFNDD